jgi:hypothetical protein
MKDGIGNTITEGSFAWWKSKELLVQVIKVHEEHNPPIIVLAVNIPIEGVPHNVEEVVVGDLLCVINPDSDRVVDRMMAEDSTIQ